jgi:hypothetical protein
MSKEYNILSLSRETYESLAKYGTLGDTFDSTVQRLIKSASRQDTREQRKARQEDAEVASK